MDFTAGVEGIAIMAPAQLRPQHLPILVPTTTDGLIRDAKFPMASRKHKPSDPISVGPERKGQGNEIPDDRVNQPSSASRAVGSSTTRDHGATPKQSYRKKIRAKVEGFFSGAKAPTRQPMEASLTIEQKARRDDAEANTLDQPPSAVRPSTTQVHASKRSRIRDGLRGTSSGTIRPTTPTPPTPQPIPVSHTIEQETPRDTVGNVSDSGNLFSKRADEVPEEATGTNDTKMALLDLGIGAIDLLRQVSDVAGLVLPNPVGPVLEKVTAVLGTLKQMMENKGAWKDLLKTLDTHQRGFNEQLTRLEAEDLNPNSTPPLLGPIKQYSSTLEEILAAIMKESGLDVKNSPSGGNWTKVKHFCSKFAHASSEPEQVQAYIVRVSAAMNEFERDLVMYTSFTVNEMNDKLDGIGTEVRQGNRKLDYENTVSKDDAILAQLKLTNLQYGSPLLGCMEGTRLDILEKIKEWTMDFDAPNILWLKGHPGVGKSAIATNVVEQLRTLKRLGSNFFFQRQKAAVMTTNVLWCTVAYDLARRHYTIREQIVTALKEDETIPTTVNVDKIFRLLIEQPITANKDIAVERLPLVVIDALDECGGLDGQHSEVRRSLMRTLESWSRLPGRFKLIVTGRNESDIALLFSTTKHHPIELSAGQTVEAQSSEDIRTFLKHQLQQRVVRQYQGSLSADWPGPQIVDDLTAKAAGLFIWANTVVKFIGLGEPQQRLNLVLKGSGTGDMKALYSQVLSTSFPHPNEDEINNFHRIVGTVILAKEPLSFPSLRRLLSLAASPMRHICNGLQSILESKDILQFHHQSFVDFLVDPDRCPPMFLVKQEQETRNLTLACLRVMKEELRFNICGLKSSYLRNVDIPNLESLVEECILPHVSYSSRFWAAHLAESPFHLNVLEALQYFMENQFLFWLEVLSLTKHVNLASGMLLSLIDWIQAGGQDNALARDLRRFIAGFLSVIAQSAPHIYLSALPFSPRNSAVSKQYRDRFPRTLVIQTGGLSSWPAIQNVMSGHSASVTSTACTPDGRRIVSGSWDNTIRVWDAETGQVVMGPLEGHHSGVQSLAFSPDGRHFVSGSEDHTIRVWDAKTGEVLAGPFEGHSQAVRSVAFSPDGTRIVSGSEDCTIRLWNAETGDPILGPLKGHSQRVISAAFSPDGNRIASSSFDKTIRVWDAETGNAVAELFIGHSDQIRSVAFAPNGKHIVSGSDDCTIRVWDAKTGEVLAGPFKGHSGWVCSVAFSPDGTRIASGSSDKTIRVWDAETGEEVAGPFKGHGGVVTSVAFLPDGRRIVSGSDDHTIRVWDAEAGLVDTVPFEGHSGSIECVAFSPDGTRIVSGSSDHTIRVWNAETSEPIVRPLGGHSGRVSSISFSLDGKRIASGSWDGTILVWDAETGQVVVWGKHTKSITSVAFSPDGRRIASGSSDDTILVWNADTARVVARPFIGHSSGVNSVVFSTDGNRIVSGSWDKTLRIWDATTSKSVAGPFKGHDDRIWSVALSPDGRRIASGSDDKTIQVWDADTGEVLAGPLTGHIAEVRSVAFSPDGKRIVSGSWDHTIRMWDAGTGEMIAGPFHGHSQEVTSVAFSPDGSCLVSGSYDKTIRVWDTMIGGSKVTESSPFTETSEMSDGWILGSKSELLFWVPPSLREGLFWPNNRAIIGNLLTTKLDLARFVHGESWSQCKE